MSLVSVLFSAFAGLIAMGGAWSIWQSLLRKRVAPKLSGRYQAARQWLEGNGYEVLKEKCESEWTAYYDDRVYRVPLAADFIVRKGAHTYAVNAGSGDSEMTVERLQSEGYPVCAAFGVDGLLVIDVEREAVHTADFELKHPSGFWVRRAMNRSLWLLSGVLIAFAWMHRVP